MDGNNEFKQICNPSDRKYEKIDDIFEFKTKIVKERSGFHRDRDRILFSRAFRRLEHKAQVYSPERGDHFRTRLTHTLEVSQIARSLAKYLNIDEDLVEAIALGHDIGHAPFGHQGERTLNEIMIGTDNLGGMIRHKIDNGGFKHNYNSLRVLDVLECKYMGISGLNLSWQVLEGVFKHTKHKNDKYDINRFINDPSRTKDLFLDRDESVTLEGQVVAIADEIAQRQHDIDDGMRDLSLNLDIITITSEILELIEDIESEIISNKYKYIKGNIELIRLLKVKLEDIKIGAEANINNSGYKCYAKNKIVRDIIEYFILDVLIESENNLDRTPKSSYPKSDNVVINRKIIKYSSIGKSLDEEIETYIKNKIVNSYDVNRFDGKARFIIRQIFKAYYTNPRQMPRENLDKITKRFRDLSNNQGYNHQDFNEIDFSTSQVDSIDNFLKLLKLEFVDLEKITCSKCLLDRDKLKLILKDNEENNDSTSGEKIKEVRSKKMAGKYLDDTDEFIWYLGELNYIFLSVICDYIAGMTDNYAKKEYKELYLVL